MKDVFSEKLTLNTKVRIEKKNSKHNSLSFHHISSRERRVIIAEIKQKKIIKISEELKKTANRKTTEKINTYNLLII